MRTFHPGDIVRRKSDGKLGFVTEATMRYGSYSTRGQSFNSTSIYPFDRHGKWAWFNDDELELVGAGPVSHRVQEIDWTGYDDTSAQGAS